MSELAGLLVTSRGDALLPVAQETRPGFLGLAHENHVGEFVEIVLLDGHPGPADDGESAALLDPPQDLAHAKSLHAHSGDSHDVRLSEPVEIDLLDALVDQRHVVLARSERGQQGQAGRRHVGSLAKQRQRVLKPPIRRLKRRIDEHDVCHDRPQRDCKSSLKDCDPS